MRQFRRSLIVLLLVVAVVAVGSLAGLSVGPAGAQQPTPASIQPTPTATRPPTQTPRPGVPTNTPVPGATQSPRPPQAPAIPAAPVSGPGNFVTARITYPVNGQVIALQPLLAQFDVQGIQLNASLIGQASTPGVGHWLLLVDGVEVAAGDAREVYLSGVAAGSHDLALHIRNNDRSPLVPPVGTTVAICVEVCDEVVLPLQPDLPEVPGGLPRTGTGGLLNSPP